MNIRWFWSYNTPYGARNMNMGRISNVSARKEKKTTILATWSTNNKKADEIAVGSSKM